MPRGWASTGAHTLWALANPCFASLPQSPFLFPPYWGPHIVGPGQPLPSRIPPSPLVSPILGPTHCGPWPTPAFPHSPNSLLFPPYWGPHIVGPGQPLPSLIPPSPFVFPHIGAHKLWALANPCFGPTNCWHWQTPALPHSPIPFCCPHSGAHTLWGLATLGQYWASIGPALKAPPCSVFACLALGECLECLSPHIMSMWLQGGGFGTPPTLGNWEMSCGLQAHPFLGFPRVPCWRHPAMQVYV